MLTALATGVVIPLLLVLWSSGPLRRSPWPALAVLGWSGWRLALVTVANIHDPRAWDFGCFWLYGHIAAAHLNVYDPAVFARFPSPFATGDDFRSAVLDVGFPYPPPTIVLFLPLALFASVPAALTAWYALGFIALAGAALVLARAVLPGDGPGAPVLVLAIIVTLPATLITVANAQTNFILLLVIALALRDRQSAAGGIWVALATWVKPFAAAILLSDLVRRSWKRVLAALLTAVASLAAAALLLGAGSVWSYFRANPGTREPAYVYAEIYNQSLLGTMLRSRPNLPAHISLIHEPLYLAGALLLIGLTAALCARPVLDSEAAFAAALLAGLLVYPGSLGSYGVVLIVPLLIVWRNRDAFPGGVATTAAVAALAAILQSTWPGQGFAANLLMWGACAYLLLSGRAVRAADTTLTGRELRAAAGTGVTG